MECWLSSPEAFAPKGIKFIFICSHEPKDIYFIEDLHEHASLISESLSRTLGVGGLRVVFSDNEVIGSDYMLYSFKVFHEGDYVGTCRFVTYCNKLIKSLCTISSGMTFEKS